MYLSSSQILRSIDALAHVHPFHGITFLVCKKEQLPVGKTTNFPLDASTRRFLQGHHRLSPKSKWFYQPYKSSAKDKKWVTEAYPAKGLQSINTRTFRDAFLHPKGTQQWGWRENYVEVVASKLYSGHKIPAFHLAVWIYRDNDWDSDASAATVVSTFKRDYNITNQESTDLFDMDLPQVKNLFVATKSTWDDLSESLSQPPDAEPEGGGALAFLETRGIGPAERLTMTPAERLTLITGDNGLGKSFLMECAWWSLTGFWAERPMLPREEGGSAQITFAIAGQRAKPEPTTINFNPKSLSWAHPRRRPTIPGLIVYARADGSFAVWDPAQQTVPYLEQSSDHKVFTSHDV